MAKLKRARVWEETFVIGVAAMLLAPCAVLAQNPPTQPPPDPIAIYREAGIDQGQERKLMSLVNSYEKAEDVKAHNTIARLKQLKVLSLSPDLDEKAILQAQTDINKMQNEMAMDKMHLLINIRRVLTQNQRLKLVSLLQSKNNADGAK